MCQEKCYSSDEAIIAQMAQFVKMVWLHYVKEGARLHGGAFLFILLRRREKYGIIHMLNHASFRFLRRRKNLENFITMHPRMDGSV